MARASLQQVMGYSNGGQGGYQAAKSTRFNKFRKASNRDENGQPRGDITNLRKLSWELWRNNPHARKICRSLESKVIGKGMNPQSQATRADGTPHIEFRQAATTIWNKMQYNLDYRGKPGLGGQRIGDLARTALRTTILGGEVLVRITHTGQDSYLPKTQIRLIHPDRLCDQQAIPSTALPPERFYYGIEFDENERRSAYHLYKYHPSDPRAISTQPIVRVPAREIIHVYVGEDVDQLRGTPWFSAALSKMQDTADYEYNELKAAAVAACVVLGYRRSTGQTGFGLQNPDDWDLTDADGNKLTSMQPGMIVDLGRNGDLVPFNPMRPNSQAGEFIQHLIRSQSVSVPGTKSSTLTADYRNSSFSSERSAENDVWPELECLQEWFSSCFYQRIYEDIMIEAVATGLISTYGVQVDIEDFVQRKDEYLCATWQGPVSRSINPTDDAKAARERIRNAQSSPQIEASALGRDWQAIVRDIAEFTEYCYDLGLPESYIAQALGIDQDDQPLATEDEALESAESEDENDAEEETDDTESGTDDSAETA